MTTPFEKENAVIESTNLGVQYTDHGILSFNIFLSYGGRSQAFGGRILDSWDDVTKRRVATPLASSLLLALDAVFAKDWEKLPGTSCRAYHSWTSVEAIGHFLQDKWLWYSQSADEYVAGTFDQMLKESTP